MSTKHIVLIVIGVVLAGVVSIGIVATWVVVQTAGRSEEAKAAKARAELRWLADSTELFHIDHGRWPASYEELIRPPSLAHGRAAMPYIREIPRDPWSGEPYLWREVEPGGKPVYCSLGADGSEGGEGVDADLRSDSD